MIDLLDPLEKKQNNIITKFTVLHTEHENYKKRVGDIEMVIKKVKRDSELFEDLKLSKEKYQ